LPFLTHACAFLRTTPSTRAPNKPEGFFDPEWCRDWRRVHQSNHGPYFPREGCLRHPSGSDITHAELFRLRASHMAWSLTLSVAPPRRPQRELVRPDDTKGSFHRQRTIVTASQTQSAFHQRVPRSPLFACARSEKREPPLVPRLSRLSPASNTFLRTSSVR
jgi:hypothetical protein